MIFTPKDYPLVNTSLPETLLTLKRCLGDASFHTGKIDSPFYSITDSLTLWGI